MNIKITENKTVNTADWQQWSTTQRNKINDDDDDASTTATLTGLTHAQECADRNLRGFLEKFTQVSGTSLFQNTTDESNRQF